jgi:Tol biopolymer transport system component
MRKLFFIVLIITFSLLPFSSTLASEAGPVHHAEEVHLKNVTQLTFGGENAEAYFSADGSRLIFQSTREPYECDQIFLMNTDGTDVKLLSTGKGATTCAFFYPGGDRFLYASTHLGGDSCPPEPDRSRGYVWPLFKSYDIFAAGLADDGSVTNLTRLTKTDRYDAEGALSPDGKKIVFTSLRDGDLELYTMNPDGSDVKRLTDREGFDGGPFFSWDGKYIVYRSHYPDDGAGETGELADYRALLSEDLMRPRRAEIFYMNADGSGQTQVTDTGHANWSPFMHPDGERIIFSSNQHDEKGRTFSLYMVNRDGSGLEKVTHGARFDSFPMFSRDGKKLVWSSTRNAKGRHEFNIFIADWVD